MKKVLEPWFFKASKTYLTTAVVDPTLPTARGDPVFGCASEEVPLFVPPHVGTHLFYPDKVSFQVFLRLLYIEVKTHNHECKNHRE